MANNIFQKIKTHNKQTTVVKDDKLVIPGQPKIEDKVSEINKNLGVTFSGEDGGDQYVKDMTAERDRRQPNMPLKEYMELKDRQNAQAGNTDFQGTEDGENVDATQWSDQDVDYGNRTEQVVTSGQDGTPDRNVVLDNTYQVNQSRVEAGKQKRREGMIDRSTKRRDKRAFRLLNKQLRKTGKLTPEQQKTYDYLEQNRYTGGVTDNYNTDSSGKITGNKLSDLSGNMNLGITGTTKTSGGSEATLANIEAFKKTYGYTPKVIDNQIQPPDSNNQSAYKMTGYSGYQENPSAPNKKKLLERVFQGVGKLLRGSDEAADVSKVTKNADNVADAASDTKKFSKTADSSNNLPAVKSNNLPARTNQVGPYTGPKISPTSGGMSLGQKISAGIAAISGAGAALTLGLTNTSSNSRNDNNTEPTVTPPKKTGKSYDQAYKDRNRKTYGHMNKSDYIKEAKRQNDVFKSTGKWDYKNAPKDPGPVSTIKPAKINTNMGQTTQLNTKPVDVDLSALDTRSEVQPNVSKKQEKLGNRIGRLEGKKSTPRRERKINKLQQKQAGVDRSTIRANKVINKNLGKSYNALTEGKIGKAVRNYGKAQRHVDKPNPNVTNTLAGKEAELIKAAGFKQKGWAGFQK